LCRHERHGSFFFANFADGSRFLESFTSFGSIALRFARLAGLRIVLERLLKKERLLTGCENERLFAIRARQYSIFKRWHTLASLNAGATFPASLNDARSIHACHDSA
jgi:hypothetical protein